MAETKLTDDEIIKALELCNKPVSKGNCKICPFYKNRIGCSHTMLNEAIDLIKRQKTVIEKNEKIIKLADKTIEKQDKDIRTLNKGIKVQEFMIGNQPLKIQGAKNGAIEQLVKRIKEEINLPLEVWKVFDNIVKEVKGNEMND